MERQRSKPALRVAIDKVLRQQTLTDFTALKEALKRAGVDLAFRRNKDGYIYGLNFIDHRNYTVFNGSDLGKAYSAKVVVEKLAEAFLREKPQVAEALLGRLNATNSADTNPISGDSSRSMMFSKDPEALQKPMVELLLQSEYTSSYLPSELRRTRRKKRKRTIK